METAQDAPLNGLLVTCPTPAMQAEWDALASTKATVTPDNLIDFVLSAMQVFTRHGDRSLKLVGGCVLAELNGVAPVMRPGFLEVAEGAQYNPGQVWNQVDRLEAQGKVRTIKPPDIFDGVDMISHPYHEQREFVVLDLGAPRPKETPRRPSWKQLTINEFWTWPDVQAPKAEVVRKIHTLGPSVRQAYEWLKKNGKPGSKTVLKGEAHAVLFAAKLLR